jgi:hypothetical protein
MSVPRKTPCREVAGIRGDHHLGYFKLACEERCKERACPAERHKRRPASVKPTFDGDLSDRVRHVRSRDRDDTESGVLNRKPEGMCNRRKGGVSPFEVKPNSTSKRAFGQHAEDKG